MAQHQLAYKYKAASRKQGSVPRANDLRVVGVYTDKYNI